MTGLIVFTPATANRPANLSERIEAPTAALEYARRLAQHGVPVNELVRAYRLGQRRMNELVFAELHSIDMPDATRVAVIEAISAALFDYIDWMS